MFFQVTLQKELMLHPKHFGPKMRETLRQKLKEEVEGTVNGRYGYIVLVTKIHDSEPGIVKEGTGWAQFKLEYECIVFRPFKGEILECVVKEVNHFGFFAYAGPQQIFVSDLGIPNEFKFSSVDEPCWVSSDGMDRICNDCEVRLKIVGTVIDNTEIRCVATIKEDYLGLISE